MTMWGFVKKTAKYFGISEDNIFYTTFVITIILPLVVTGIIYFLLFFSDFNNMFIATYKYHSIISFLITAIYSWPSSEFLVEASKISIEEERIRLKKRQVNKGHYNEEFEEIIHEIGTPSVDYKKYLAILLILLGEIIILTFCYSVMIK